MKGVNLKFADDVAYEEIELRDDFLAEIAINFDILEPESNQVFIDLDTEEDFKEFNLRLSKLLEICCSAKARENVSILEGYSKSGYPHRHIIVTLPFQLEPAEQVAIQFALNSDPMREFLSICRTLNGYNKPNCLFRPKLKEKEVNSEIKPDVPECT